MGNVPKSKVVKKYKEKARREGYLEACEKFIKLFDLNISQQVIDYYNAGIDVKVFARNEIKASELFKILRGE